MNKTPIILTDQSDLNPGPKWKTIRYQSATELVDIVRDLEDKVSNKPVVVYHFDLDELWVAFVSQFRYVHAAGGLVMNDEGNFLAIYRNNKWDLPKGHLKKGERPEYGGMREVEEECGVTGLSIHSHLENTFHMYDRGGLVLKKTFWYNMRTTHSEELVPQEEEGITEVAWKSPSDAKKMMKNSYPIIQGLLEKGLKKKKKKKD